MTYVIKNQQQHLWGTLPNENETIGKKTHVARLGSAPEARCTATSHEPARAAPLNDDERTTRNEDAERKGTAHKVGHVDGGREPPHVDPAEDVVVSTNTQFVLNEHPNDTARTTVRHGRRPPSAEPN